MPALQRGKTHLSETLWTAVHGEAAGVSDAEGEGARQRDLDKVQTELRAWYVGEVRRIFEAAAKREARATKTAAAPPPPPPRPRPPTARALEERVRALGAARERPVEHERQQAVQQAATRT